MIPLAVPNLCGREAEYLAECVRSNFVSSAGPFVERFEGMVAEAAGAAQAVATCNGTAALHAALIVVGVEPGDLVVCPTLTFIATGNAIAHAGADPWLMDVSANRWTLDPELLAAALESEAVWTGGRLTHRLTGKRVAAVLPVHTLGHPADMDLVVNIARRYSLPVVADGAAALGALYKGRPSGRLGADLTMYSFNGNKTVTSGGGGAVVGDDPRLMAALKHITTTARVGTDYVHDRVGYNYRMTNLEAAVGCAQMENLAAFVAAKRRIAARYDAAFASTPELSPFPRASDAESACWFAGTTLRSDLADAPRALGEQLRRANIDARQFWRPLHLQKPFGSSPRTGIAVAEDVSRRILTLPCSTSLSEHDQDHVVANVKRALHAL
jgi:perosamine synthetase